MHATLYPRTSNDRARSRPNTAQSPSQENQKGKDQRLLKQPNRQRQDQWKRRYQSRQTTQRHHQCTQTATAQQAQGRPTRQHRLLAHRRPLAAAIPRLVKSTKPFYVTMGLSTAGNTTQRPQTCQNSHPQRPSNSHDRSASPRASHDGGYPYTHWDVQYE